MMKTYSKINPFRHRLNRVSGSGISSISARTSEFPMMGFPACRGIVGI